MEIFTSTETIVRNKFKVAWNHEYEETDSIYFIKSSLQSFPMGHSCMPSPLSPDPIRVQSCVCRLF